MPEFGGNPLASDDRYLNNPRAIEFGGSPAGLDLAGAPGSFGGSPGGPMGLQGMPDMGNSDPLLQQLGQIANAPLFTPRAPSTEAQIFYSPSTGDIVVNGRTPFNQRNASAALASTEWVNQPAQQFSLPDTATDWREMSRPEYDGYIDSIRNPGYGRRMGEAWEHAWRGMGDVALGASLAVNPEWEWAEGARANILREYEENAPFMLGLRDVKDPGDALTYVSQLLVQGAPWLVETLASMAVGGAIGGAVSGGVGAPAGAIEGVLAKEALRRATTGALRNNLRRGATAYAAVAARRGAANTTRQSVIAEATRTGAASADDVERFFNFGERAYHLARGQRFGGTAAMVGSNYMTGVGDIRNAIADSGADPTSAESIANIWGLALPYAAIESVGDLILTQPLTHLFPGITSGPSRIGNAARTGLMVGAAEAIQEPAQYAITQQGVADANNEQLSLEPIDLLENALGGFFGGAGIGAVTGALGDKIPAAPNRLALPPPAMVTPAPTTPGPNPLGGSPQYMGGMEIDPDGMPDMGGVTPPPPPPFSGSPQDMGGLEFDTGSLPDMGREITPQPPGLALSQNLELGGRTPEEIFQAVASGEQIGPEEAQQLRTALEELRMQNPTESGYTEVIQQLDDIMAPEAGAVTDENSPEFQQRYPELTSYIATRPEPISIPPMDAAQPPVAKPLPTANPIMSDGLPQYGPHRLKAPVTAEGKEIPPLGPTKKKNKTGAQKRKLRAENNAPIPNVTGGSMSDKLGRMSRSERSDQSRREAESRQAELEARDDKRVAEAAEKERVSNGLKKIADRLRKQDAEERIEKVRTAFRTGKGSELTDKELNQAVEDYKNYGDDNAHVSVTSVEAEIQRRKDVIPFPKKKEEPDAVRERSAEKETVRDEPRASEATGSRDTAGDKAPGASTEQAKPSVQKPEVSSDRVKKARAAVEYLAKKEGKDARQKVAGVWSRVKHGKTTKQAWASVDGVPLTKEEFVALIQALDADGNNPGAKPRPEPVNDAAEKKAKRFGDDLSAALQQDKADPKSFAEFVQSHTAEVVSWITSEDAKVRAGLRIAAERVLRDSKPVPAANKPAPLTMPDYAKHIKVRAFDIEALKIRKRQIAGWLMRVDSWLDDLRMGRVSTNENGLWSIVYNGKLLSNAIQSWRKYGLDRPVLQELIALRDELKATLDEFRDANKPQRAASRSPQGGIVFDVLRRVLRENPEFTFRPVHPATRARAKLIIDEIHKAQEAAGFPKSSVESLTVNLAALRRALRENTQRNVSNEKITGKHGLVTKAEVEALVKQVQKRIAEPVRFRSTHVFKDLEDLFHRANDEIMIAPNGAEVSIGRYLMGEAMYLKAQNKNNPVLAKLTDMQWATIWARGEPTIGVQSGFDFRAAVIPHFNALVIFSDKQGDTRSVMEVLEHEYVVHRGLRAIFENNEERFAFLHRFGMIPGVEAKRAALVKQHPVYENMTRFEQLEEVIAYHAMEGPLALERLLSAPEAIDQGSRRTLWENFKEIVTAWIKRVFNGFRKTEDEALDAIVSHLREHAVTGFTGDMNYTIYKTLTRSQAITEAALEIKAALDNPDSDKIIKAAATLPAGSTVDDVIKMLYGTDTDPGRPHTPTPWAEGMVETIRGNEPLLEKLTSTGKASGTSVREALRKAGRNIEPLNNMSHRSTLIEKVMQIMHNTIGVARRIMTKRLETRKYASTAEETAAWRKLWGDKSPGSTKKQREAYGRMAIVATNSKLPKATESVVRAAPRLLVRHGNGVYEINYAVFEELLKKGTFSKQEFIDGIEQFTVHGNGQTEAQGIAKLPKEVIDEGYDMYVMETRHMAESKLETLEHALIMLNRMNDASVAKIIRDNKFSETDMPFVTETLQRMYKLYADIAFHNHTKLGHRKRASQKDAARQVLAELMRSMHSKANLADWTDATKVMDEKAKSPRKQNAFKWREQTNPHDDVRPFTAQIAWFLANDPATGKNRLARMNEIYDSEKGQRQYDMLGAFQSLLNSETLTHEHENDVIQSVLGNYVEFVRDGEWRVSIEVKDEKGKRADISVGMATSLPVVYAKSQREAQDIQAKFNAAFAGEHEMKNAEGDPIKVTFDLKYARAPGTRTMAEAPSLKQFLEVADVAGLTLDASQMKQIANLIENAGSRKRFGLQRAGTPGMSANILKNNSEYMTRNAWWAAKMSQAYMLEDVMADEKNVTGDWDRLADLQYNFDVANRGAPEGKAPPIGFVRSEELVYITETALVRYANQLRHMAEHALSRPTVNIRTTRGEQKLKIEPEGKAHHDHAVALVESLKRNELELNLNDLLSKTGPLRMAAVVLQLGSIAAGIMNAFTLITHLPWVLMAKHKQTGYGEGLSFSAIVAEIMTAVTQVGVRLNMTDSAIVKEMLDKAKAGDTSTGMTVEELEFLYQETLEGLLMPQQTYSMTGGTQSNISDLVWRDISEALLLPFGAIEAANRRISALVSYRLTKDRVAAAKMAADMLSDYKLKGSPLEVSKEAKDAVERVVYQSQGDYANINRPKAMRGDLAQYVMMYKMFPLMTQTMLYNLPTAQQLSVLGVLFLLGGLKGEPFADDFMDIYDTLLQKLGFKHDSVELSMVQTLEGIMPGSSKWIMYGGIDSLAFGGTMSSRISMGDILPLTGVLREEADFGREVANAFGPAYAANMAALEYAWILTDFMMQMTGIKTRTMPLEELVRKFPQSGLRGAGEAALMLGTGEITDPDGRLVSDNVNMFSVFARALGLYPLEATKANTAVRLDRMHTGYIRATRARFILAYANAYRHDDEATMNRINESVRNWNEAAEATGQEDMMIRNFRQAGIRAGRAASQTTVERTASSAPDYSVLEEVAEAINADTESEDD